MPENEIRSNLLPLVRDLETILLRRLVIELKHKYHNNRAIDAIIAEARYQWKTWHKLSTDDPKLQHIAKVETHLWEYLQTQLLSQLSEGLLLKNSYLEQLEKYLKTEEIADEDKARILEQSEKYGISSRYYPAYIPDMRSMLEYSLRSVRVQDNVEGREVIEAINQKFIAELGRYEQLLQGLGLMGERILVEISPPKPRLEDEYFLRVWELVDIGNGGNELWRWQVTNYSVPVTPSAATATIKTEFQSISSTKYLGVAEMINPSHPYISLSQLQVIEKRDLNNLIQTINPDFRLSPIDTQLVSSFVTRVVKEDLREIQLFLGKIIHSLTKRVTADILRQWEQLLLVILLRHCEQEYVAARVGQPLNLQPAQITWLQSPEPLELIREGKFNNTMRRQHLPNWMRFNRIKQPKPPQVNLKEVNKYFHNSDVTSQIEAAKLDKELMIADLMV